MALTKEDKEKYNESLKGFKDYIEDLKKEVSLYKVQSKRSKPLEPYYQIAIVLNSLKLINTCLNINKLSVHLLKLKSELYLNIARKELYSIISNLERVFGNDYENGLDENRELLDKVTEFNPLQRYNFLVGFKHSLTAVIDGYGKGSKWIWSWPELHLKLAVLSKNMFDFRAYEREKDLDNPFYHVREAHFDFIIDLSSYAAQEYRSKFDLSTSDTGDLRKSVSLLEMNRKIFQITGKTEDLEKTKTLIESLEHKIDALESDKDKKKKKK